MDWVLMLMIGVAGGLVIDGKLYGNTGEGTYKINRRVHYAVECKQIWRSKIKFVYLGVIETNGYEKVHKNTIEKRSNRCCD